LGVAPTIEHIPVLRQLQVDGIFDIGANRGQFSLACRLGLPGVPIVAFEPIPSEAKIFKAIHADHPEIRLLPLALGDATGEAELHLSARADSSSLLPIGAGQVKIFPGTEEVGKLKVPVRRLDELAAEWRGRTRQLLKLDVQGFELQVLRGASETLRHCACVYVECSELPLYEGQALRSDVAAFLQEHRFAEPLRFNPVYQKGRLIQADYLFIRSDLSGGKRVPVTA
jgi:FkbM family methyltransferase